MAQLFSLGSNPLQTMKSNLIVLAVLSAAAFVVVGCSKKEGGAPPPPTTASTDNVDTSNLTAAVAAAAADTLSVDITTIPGFKAFITNYVAAINSKDRAKLNQCIHAKSVAMLATDQKYSDAIYEGKFAYSIPADVEFYAHTFPADKPQSLVFTPRPAYQVQIKFKTTTTDITYLILWIANENDKWYEVLPSGSTKN